MAKTWAASDYSPGHEMARPSRRKQGSFLLIAGLDLLDLVAPGIFPYWRTKGQFRRLEPSRFLLCAGGCQNYLIAEAVKKRGGWIFCPRAVLDQTRSRSLAIKILTRIESRYEGEVAPQAPLPGLTNGAQSR